MKITRRAATSVSAFLVATVAIIPFLIAAPAAATATVVTLTGAAAPTAAIEPANVTFTYTITVTNAAATASVLTTTQASQLPVVPASVEFDGAAVPIATVTANGADLVLRLGSGADSTHGGTVAVGTHTVTFSAALSSTTAAQTTSTATIVSNAGSVMSDPVAVSVNQPDLTLSLPADSGETAPLPLGTDVDGYFDVELRNLGAAVPATVTLTLPAGLVLGSDGVAVYNSESDLESGNGTTLPCAGTTGTVTCALATVAATGATTNPPIIEADLQATAAGTPGSSAAFSLAVVPTHGTDLDPSNNTTTATIDFTGVADLTFAITPSPTSLTVGHTTRVTVRITNHGPQPALDAQALILLQSTNNVIISGFDGSTGSLPASSFTRHETRSTLLRHQRAASAPTGVSVVVTDSHGAVDWLVGTIPAGTTATAHLDLTPKSAGDTQLILVGGSAAADPGCVNPTDACTPATDHLVIAAAAVPTPTPTTSSSGGGVLADTGSDTSTLSFVGLLLLATGGLALITGRRRSPRAH